MVRDLAIFNFGVATIGTKRNLGASQWSKLHEPRDRYAGIVLIRAQGEKRSVAQ